MPIDQFQQFGPYTNKPLHPPPPCLVTCPKLMRLRYKKLNPLVDAETPNDVANHQPRVPTRLKGPAYCRSGAGCPSRPPVRPNGWFLPSVITHLSQLLGNFGWRRARPVGIPHRRSDWKYVLLHSSITLLHTRQKSLTFSHYKHRHGCTAL